MSEQVSPPSNREVTFLFTDIEGSTRLWETEPRRMADALSRHDQLCRATVARHGGRLVKMIGDGLHAAFADPADAVATTLDLQRGMAAIAADVDLPFRMRCGLHAGASQERDGDYFGSAVIRAARLMSAAHGGQILLSKAVVDLGQGRFPDGAGLLPLGRVHLRDLSAPEDVWQLQHPDLVRVFPALRSLDSAPNNLPRQLSSFIGREKEIGQIKEFLRGTRLLTLTGSGGCGKTRLAIQVGADLLENYRDGVWLVELAALADPGLLPQTVAAVLGLREERGKSPTQVLSDHLKSRQLLLVLDNAEHLLAACAQLADALLRLCPHVVLLATSREGLGIAGERTFRVPSLSLPDPKHDLAPARLLQYEAVRLFTERAQSHRPQFAVTDQNAPALASICVRLDGIPLAVELAAARTRTLSIEEINQRLDQRFRLLTGGSRVALPRQQTLRSLIDWSYDLLDPSERLLLQRLSVFAGGWSLESAERICADEALNEDQILDRLTSLVDKSLVQPDLVNDRFRYRLLETVRQYAREKLDQGDDGAAVRRRHRDYFLAVAVEAESKLASIEQRAWLDRLAAEHENLQASLEWSVQAADVREGVRLCGALEQYWITRGHLAEGREWCTRFLAMDGADVPSRERANALSAAGMLAFHQSDAAAATVLLEECLAVERKQESPERLAIVLGNMGLVAFERADLSRAMALHEESLAIMRVLGNPSGISGAMNNLAGVYYERGELQRARSLLEECLAIKRTLGDERRIANSICNLASVALDQGDLDAARALYEEGMAIMRELGNPAFVATSLDYLGRVAVYQGDYRAAHAHSTEALAIMRELQHRTGIANALHNLANVAVEQKEFSAARGMFEESLATRNERGDRRGIVASLRGLGAVTAGLGDPIGAARIWCAANQAEMELGVQLSQPERSQHEHCIARARATADADAFDRALHESPAMTLDEAMHLALANSFVGKR